MNKLELIAASIAGALIALVGIGYVDGVVHRDEALALLGALAIGAWAWDKVDKL